nr:ABC transporter substrate-binding protein [uncultured Fusobacterium sp.]
MKKFKSLLFSLFLILSMVIFGAEKTIYVGAPKAPPILPVLRMMETNALGKDYKIDIKVWNSPEILIAMVQGKEADFFAFPVTVVSKLYNKGLNVKLMNVNTWGVASFISKDPSVKSWKDLKDKTIYIGLKSSPPDVYTHYFLDKEGLKEKKDYNVIYANKAEILNLVISGKADNAVTIEPDTTAVLSKNKDFKIIANFEEEWQKYKGDKSSIPTAGFGVIGEVAEKDPALVKKFNEEYAKALQWVKENPEEAGKLAKEKLGMDAEVIKKSIPKMGLNFVHAQDAKKTLNEYYKIMKDYDPKNIGGKVPDENLYLNK